MKIIDVLRLSLGNLIRNKMRTFLTVIGVSIGIGAIVFLVSLGFGLQNLATSKITSLDSLTVINLVKPDDKFTKELVTEAKGYDGVEGVSYTYSLPTKAADNEKAEGTEAILYGILPKFIKLEEVNVNTGKADFSGDDAKEVILSKAALKIFNNISEKDILGKEIYLTAGKTESNTVKWDIPNNKAKYKVVGVTPEDQNTIFFIPISNLENLGIANYSSVKVKIDKNQKDKLSDVKAKLEAKGFETSSIKDTLDQINKVFLIVKIVLGGFGMIALFVASIGIFNTMTISLLERTHEIGIMKAIGGTDKDVKRTFLTEAATIGLLGGAIGVLMGVGFCYLINYIADYLAVSFGGQPQKLFSTPMSFVGQAIFFSFIVSFVAGVYPAKRASKLNPIDALRYE